MIEMTTNDVVIRHNFISKILFKDNDFSLSKDLKIKIMSMRIEYGKVHKVFDEDIKEFTTAIISDRFNELANNPNRTEEENDEYNSLVDQYNQETNEYVSHRMMDPVNVNEYYFTTDEYSEILEANASNDVVINDRKIPAPDFLEAIYDLFVDDKTK